MYQRKRQLKQRIEDLQAKVEMLEKENFALREETYMSDGVFKHNPLLSWYGKELCLAFGRILVAPRYLKLDFDQYSKYMRDVLDYLKEIRLLEESYQRRIKLTAEMPTGSRKRKQLDSYCSISSSA